MKFSIRRKNKTTAFVAVMALLLCCLPFKVSAQGQLPAHQPESVVEGGGFSARTVFQNLQCPALEILKKTTRLDMLDYWDADSIIDAKNAMEGLSNLVKITPDYLKVQLTPVSTFEIKLLSGKKGETVMTIYTIGADSQASDSQVDFYNTMLQPIETEKCLQAPDLKDFFEIPKGSATTMKEIQQMVPFPTVMYSAEPGNETLSATLTVEKYVNQDDWNILKLFLKPQITAHWKGKYKFSR